MELIHFKWLMLYGALHKGASDKQTIRDSPNYIATNIYTAWHSPHHVTLLLLHIWVLAICVAVQGIQRPSPLAMIITILHRTDIGQTNAIVIKKWMWIRYQFLLLQNDLFIYILVFTNHVGKRRTGVSVSVARATYKGNHLCVTTQSICPRGARPQISKIPQTANASLQVCLANPIILFVHIRTLSAAANSKKRNTDIGLILFSTKREKCQRISGGFFQTFIHTFFPVPNE